MLDVHAHCVTFDLPAHASFADHPNQVAGAPVPASSHLESTDPPPSDKVVVVPDLPKPTADVANMLVCPVMIVRADGWCNHAGMSCCDVLSALIRHL